MNLPAKSLNDVANATINSKLSRKTHHRHLNLVFSFSQIISMTITRRSPFPSPDKSLRDVIRADELGFYVEFIHALCSEDNHNLAALYVLVNVHTFL